MADKVTKEQRSRIMRAIKSKDTGMELLLARGLQKAGLRFRRNVASLPGKPDFVFAKKKLAIFLDSCFWHGCKRHCRLPASNRRYWIKKIARNKQRDMEINKKYRSTEWKIARFWEHELSKNLNKVIAKIRNAVD